MIKLTNVLQLIIALGSGLFGGLLWSQQFQMMAPPVHLTNPESFLALSVSDKASHLPRSIDFVQREMIHKRQHRESPPQEEEGEASLLSTHNNPISSREQQLLSSLIKTTPIKAAILHHQVEIQAEFQSILRKQQYPVDCSQSRILLSADTDKPADGFAREIQEMGRLLQVATATKRCLVVQEGWQSAYQPQSCHSNTSWPCLWQPLSSCSSESIWGDGPALMEANQSSSLAIDTSLINTAYFDTYLYGPGRIQSSRKWPWGMHAFVDIIPKWERTMGRFWIRAQISHYLWRPSPWLSEQIQARSPVIRDRYIAMHIRFTDNRNALQREFGRDAARTRRFANFMEHATQLREIHNVSTIYVSTDNDQMIDETRRRIYRKKWNFVFQTEVQRASSKRHLWFGEGRGAAAAGIATDLDVLRRADFLIGSHQSNVYRLACQLNAAHHAGRYQHEIDRHLSVDVEWFEDP